MEPRASWPQLGESRHASDVGANLRDFAEGVVGALGMLASFATPFARRARSHWGVTAALAARAYPGDERVATPKWSWTHGVEIDAPPDAVWPWIAQIGQERAGFYSYQWLENLVGCEIHNANEIHAEWGRRRVGGWLRLHPDMPALPVVAALPGRWWLAHAEPDPNDPDEDHARYGRFSMSWLFYLEPIEAGRTRFISRMRTDYEGDWRVRLMQGPTLLEPVGFVMDRRMLLGVKARVERHAPSQQARS